MSTIISDLQASLVPRLYPRTHTKLQLLFGLSTRVVALWSEYEGSCTWSEYEGSYTWSEYEGSYTLV